MTFRSRGAAAAWLALAFLVSSPAAAQQVRGFADERLEPAERGSDWFALESLDLRGHGRPAVGVVGDFASGPVVLKNPDGSLVASIVRNQYILHPGASLVAWNRVRFGLDVPIAVVQDGHQASAGGVTYAPPTGADIGDVRLGADLRLIGEYMDPVTVAVGAQVYLPSGSRTDYTGDGTVRVEPRLLAAGRIAGFTYAARVAFDYRSLDETIVGTQLGSEVLFGGAVGVKVLRDQVALGPELFGSTVVTGNGGAFSTSNTPVELLVGAHARVAEDFLLGAGVGPGLVRGIGEPLLRVVLSLEWAPGYDLPAPPDRDGDGVPDAEDACSDTRGVRTNDTRTNGCPPERQP